MQTPQKVFIRTFGCQMNKLDSELLTGHLVGHGFILTDEISDADVVLYNTCSVRGHAEERVYSHIGVLKARKAKAPRLIIGVLGCMAQKDGEGIINKMPHVDLVCGTGMLHRVPEILKTIVADGGRIVATEVDQYASIARSANHRKDGFQAYLSIMRGCDNYCSYCVVPYVRSREVSRGIEDILSEAMTLVEGGCREITLLGQNVNSYGKGLNNGDNLATLLTAISEIDRLERIRFITSHPKDMSMEILAAVAGLPKVCKYLHLPAQSGSDRMLAEMNRRYTSGYYRDLVGLARQMVPDVSISSDFIVGFPGESDADFQETVRLMEDVRFFNCFIFKYSPRPGTRAARLADDVPEAVKKERNQILLDLQAKISVEENKRQIGKTFSVLVEGYNARTSHPQTGRVAEPPKKAYNLIGRTEYNHIAVFDGETDVIGKFVDVEIEDATHLTMFGRQVIR